MKKSLVLALVAVLVLSFASMAFAFTDTPDWAKGQIDKLAEMKIVNGVSATSFNAAGNVNRAEFAKMIVLAKGIALENPATATFKDVPATAWYFPYVEAAAKAKLIEGMGDGMFAPTANITREQVAKIVVLAAGKTADATKALNFDDKASISDWAKGFVAVAADLKLMQGSNNKFAPKANATRAEGAVLVYNELVYEGKIAVNAVITSDQITDFKLDLSVEKFPLVTITMGGKKYDAATDLEITIDGKAVNGTVLRKNTHATATFNKDNDKITKLALNAKDYKAYTGNIEALGKDGSRTFAIVAASSTKLYYDVNSETFASVSLDGSDPSYDGKLAPEKDTSYVVIADENGKAYYFQKESSADVKGVVSYVGKDSTGDYLYVNDKKYYAKDNKATNVDDINGDAFTTTTWQSLAGTYVKIFLTSSQVSKVDALSVVSGYVTSKPVFFGNEADGYDVWVRIAREGTNYTFNASNITWIHYGDSKDYIADSDVPDHAVVVDGTPGDLLPAVDDDADASVEKLDKYADINIGGSSKNLGDVKSKSYVILNWDDIKADQKVDSITTYAAYAAGRVDKITKDGNYEVTELTIGGKTFDYVGKTKTNKSDDKGYTWVANAESDENGNKYVVTEVDDVVLGVLNAKGELVTLINDYQDGQLNGVEDTNLTVLNEATVTAIGGGKSVMTKNNSDADILSVPGNTIEVQYSSGGVTKVAWINLDWNDDNGGKTVSAAEVVNSTVVKASAGIDFSAIKVGDVVDVVVKEPVDVTGKAFGLAKYLYADSGATETLTDNNYALDGYYTLSIWSTNNSDGSNPVEKAFRSYQGSIISVR